MDKIRSFFTKYPLEAIILLLFIFSLSLTTLEKDAGKEVSYTKFLEMVEKDKVKEAQIIDNENHIFFTNDKDVLYKTSNPKSEDLVEELLLSDVKVDTQKPTTIAGELEGIVDFFLRILIIFYIVNFIINLMMGNNKFSSIKNSKPNTKKKKNNKGGAGGGLFGGRDLEMTIIEPDDVVELPKFKDIAGNQELKQDLQDIVDFLKHPDKFAKLGAELPKGVLLSGPPGTGKTMIAKAVAAEAGVAFIAVAGSDFIQEFVGTGAKRVRQLFEEARKYEKAIVFVDEFDAIASKRDRNSSSENTQTINALLDEMDGFYENKNLIVIAATNLFDNLDSAVIRPGRFDKKIAVALPEYEERLAILKVHANKRPMNELIDLEYYAKTTIGMSGAYLATMINEAAILAGTRGHHEIMPDDMEDSYYRIVMNGLKRESVKRNDEELRIVAKHEAGHALIAKRLTDNDVTKVTIISSTSGAGGFAMVVPKKMGLFTKEEMLNDIKVTYAGRAAEHLYFNNRVDVANLLKRVAVEGVNTESILNGFNFTTGASSDIQQATSKIYTMFTHYGMSSKYGMLHPQIINGVEGGLQDEALIEEAKILSNQLYYETLKILFEESELLDKIAEALLEKETLIEHELDAIIEQYDKEKSKDYIA